MVNDQQIGSSTSDQLAYLTKELRDRIKSFHSSVAWYRRRYYLATMSTVVLAALITIVAGWKPSLALGINENNVTLVLGALTTVISAWGAFFSPRESWLIYASTLNRLRVLEAKIDFLKVSSSQTSLGDGAITALFQEYQSTLDAHNKAWLELRSASSKVPLGNVDQEHK
jgi:hypothetical protein